MRTIEIDGDDDKIPEEIQKIIDLALDAIANGQKLVDVTDLPEIRIGFKLKGKKWDGYVDRKIASYVVSSETKLKAVLKDVGIDPAFLNGRDLVKVRVKPGCTEVFQCVTNALQHARFMTPQQLLIIFGGFATLAGLVITPIIYRIRKDAKVRMAEIEAEEKRNEIDKKSSLEMHKNIKDLAEKVLEMNQPKNQDLLHKPLADVVRKMDKEDTIDLPNTPNLRKSQAQKMLKPDTKPLVENLQMDAHYSIEVLRTPKGKEWSVRLGYGDIKPFDAKLKLDVEQEEKLYSAYKNAEGKKKGKGDVSLDLRINTNVKGKTFMNAELVGIGKPRENSNRPPKVLKIAKKAEEMGDV